MSRLDRRALFATGAAAALLAATGTSAQATARSGGTLRLAVPRDNQLMEQVGRWAVYDALTEIGPDGVLHGELALSWTSSLDARVWSFELRPDVTFHDSAPLTVDDAITSLLRSPLATGEILGVKAVSDTALRLELAEPNPHLPYLLADAAHVITRGGAPVDPLAQANGTGCYRVQRTEADRHFRAERMAQHYKDGKAGWFDAVEIIVIPDANVRAEALRDGFVDIAAFPRADQITDRRAFFFHPSAQDMALAARRTVGRPGTIGSRAPLDDGRIAERWWML